MTEKEFFEEPVDEMYVMIEEEERKPTLMEKLKRNKKTIIKRSLIVGGTIVGIIAAYTLLKDKGDYEELDYDVPEARLDGSSTSIETESDSESKTE